MMDSKEEVRINKIKHILSYWLDEHSYDYEIIEINGYPCTIKEMFYRPVSCFACKEDCIQYNYVLYY